ncbi:unnamed protein product [Phytomonas sp. EM1]|nr:unnamed protein product [Phytomonas sp. EM1]|eukprot:CCW60118.1 unnamed protein product [Phytomonas sp. isolate EM1]
MHAPHTCKALVGKDEGDQTSGHLHEVSGRVNRPSVMRDSCFPTHLVRAPLFQHHNRPRQACQRRKIRAHKVPPRKAARM